MSDKIFEEAKISIEYQQKFLFYLLGLTFTILALSIQTSLFGKYYFADLAELGGWLCLLVSGLLGLSRIEWSSVFYFLSSEKSGIEGRIASAKKYSLRSRSIRVLETGENIPIENFIDDEKDRQELYQKKIESIQFRQQLKSIIQKILFLLGIIFIIISRAYVPIDKWFINNNIQ
jgi:hypothetical protein